MGMSTLGGTSTRQRWRTPIQNEVGSAYLIFFLVSLVVAGALLGLMQLTAKINANAHRSLGQLQFNALIEQTNMLLRPMATSPSPCTNALRGVEAVPAPGPGAQRFPTADIIPRDVIPVVLDYPGGGGIYLQGETGPGLCNGTRFGNLNVCRVSLIFRKDEESGAGLEEWWSSWLRIEATLVGQPNIKFANGLSETDPDGGDGREIPILIKTADLSDNPPGSRTRVISNCSALFFRYIDPLGNPVRKPPPRCGGFRVLHYSNALEFKCVRPNCTAPQTRTGWDALTGDAICSP